MGEEECRGLLDHIVEHPGMREEFKNRCDRKKLEVIKELGELHELYCVLTAHHVYFTFFIAYKNGGLSYF